MVWVVFSADNLVARQNFFSFFLQRYRHRPPIHLGIFHQIPHWQVPSDLSFDDDYPTPAGLCDFQSRKLRLLFYQGNFRENRHPRAPESRKIPRLRHFYGRDDSIFSSSIVERTFKIVYIISLVTELRGGAMVARLAVNEKVAGSNPARGATSPNILPSLGQFLLSPRRRFFGRIKAWKTKLF